MPTSLTEKVLCAHITDQEKCCVPTSLIEWLQEKCWVPTCLTEKVLCAHIIEYMAA
jgi:hypothetical protein